MASNKLNAPFQTYSVRINIPKRHLFKVMFNLLLIEVGIAIEKFVDNVTAKIIAFHSNQHFLELSQETHRESTIHLLVHT